MSAKRLLFVSVLISIAWILGHAQFGNSNSGVIGVWSVSEMTFKGPNERTVTKPQPGIVIITPHYYSRNLVTSDAPRPDLPPPHKLTDKQIADAFGPFIANAGTYESGQRTHDEADCGEKSRRDAHWKFPDLHVSLGRSRHAVADFEGG